MRNQPVRQDHAPEGRATSRPSLLLERPEPAEAIAVTPDGPPWVLRRGGRERTIVRAIGPERIAGEWWRFREPTRDYFKVQDDTGRWLWVYREVQTNRWFIHGEWA
jgi:protein ImuB